LAAADAIEERILFEGAETVAAVILEPVQNSGGCLPPPPGYFARVREICDRHGVLLISDDTICSWGRLGTWFGADRFDYVPDIITTAKGITSAYVPMGAMIVSDRVAEPFVDGGAVFAHGLTFGGHPVAAAVALANIDLIEREDLLGHVRRHEDELRATLEDLTDLEIVGDVRGAGYFWGIELVADRATRRGFRDDEANELSDRVLGPGMRRRGLIARATDRGFPVIQLAPPLVAGPREFAEIGAVLRAVLVEAQAWAAGR
jgi:adenosylmethionine-8-amino-7-oxononanoate aminotransferase